jgi:hypothetical protein
MPFAFGYKENKYFLCGQSERVYIDKKMKPHNIKYMKKIDVLPSVGCGFLGSSK